MMERGVVGRYLHGLTHAFAIERPFSGNEFYTVTGSSWPIAATQLLRYWLRNYRIDPGSHTALKAQR
jgi:hypothetical protein